MTKDISRIPTYESGIIQAMAHRRLAKITADTLRAYDLSTMQWYVVGLAYSAGESGIRLTDLTEQLGTSLPFITTTINQLALKGVITKTHLASDNRVRIAKLEPAYLSTVEEIEETMRETLRTELYGNNNIDRKELVDYITVLYKIVGK